MIAGDSEKLQLIGCSVDPFALITARSQGYGQLHVRSWRPADELTRTTPDPYSSWDIAEFGLTSKEWASFPEIGGANLKRHLFPIDNSELVVSLPTFIASPVEIRRFAKGG